MGKNTRKPVTPRKPKHTLLPLGSPILSNFAKRKLIRKTPNEVCSRSLRHNVAGLVNQERLSCSVCLQLLLSPVLAQCGHSFCLACAENLACHGFACGICHSHDPTVDLPSSGVIQALVRLYLEQSEESERQEYQKRSQVQLIKQERRRVGQIELGMSLDFWCDRQLTWKNGLVTQHLKNGSLTLTTKKHEDVVLHSSSRKLAPSFSFTKEEPPVIQPPMQEMQIRPLQFFANRPFERMRMPMQQPPRMMRMPMQQPPRMMGMPLILGYYIPPGTEEMNQRSGLFEGVDPFNF